MVQMAQRKFLDAVGARGFVEQGRFSTYRGASRPLRPHAAEVSVRSVEGGEDERMILGLAALSYGDGPDFDSWRQWITSWDYGASLWLIATERVARSRRPGRLQLPDRRVDKRVAVVDA
jgi:hypothetical protein